MWHIDKIITPTGEQGATWGGLGASVGPQPLTARLGPENSAYIVSAGDLGAITIKDIGAGPNGSWALLINGKQKYFYNGEGHLTVTVDAKNAATISGGQGTLAVPLLREMSEIGPLTQQIVALVSTAPPLYPAWNADPMTVMYTAGFPHSAMLNLRQTIGTAPDCCAQFMAWLKTLQFSTDLERDALGGWLSCALCKAYIAGLAAATFVVVAAACIAAGPAGLAAAAAALAEAGSIAALAAAGGITVQAVAEASFITFFAAGAAAFVGSIIDEICKRTGACDGTSIIANATLPVVTA